MPQDISDREDFYKDSSNKYQKSSGNKSLTELLSLVITKARRLQHLLVAITKTDGTIFIKNT